MVAISQPAEMPEMALPDFEAERQKAHQKALSSILVVDNIPEVPEEKYDKLLAVLSKIFQKVGKLNDEPTKAIHMPKNDSGSTKGFAFISYKDTKDAAVALQTLNGYKLDKAHTFSIALLSDVQRVASLQDEFSPPEMPNLVSNVENRPDLTAWLLDDRCRDQYIVKHKEEAEIYWQDSILGSELQYGRVRWTDSYVSWSPKGNYLATFHRQGIVLWGGPNWDRIMRFAHPNVRLIEFSPCERYIVTWNGTPVERDNSKDPSAIIVWEVSTGVKLRGFVGVPESQPMKWPILRWSHDGNYVARMIQDGVSVYVTPGMGLLDKKSVKIQGVMDFVWSPTDNYIAYWTPEAGNIPARVSIMEIPSRNDIRQKVLFKVADIHLHWQQEGKFLGCKVDRLTKSKKGRFTNFELFRMREKDIPIDVLEFTEKDRIVAFAWEPKGNRFAIIHGENTGRNNVTFYSMDGIDKPILRLEKKLANALYWSPAGTNIVVAGLGQTFNGALEFVSVNEKEPLGISEHYSCTDIEWDPSGRFVTTSSSCFRTKMENGYMIHSFYGKQLTHVVQDQMFQFAWRPRPPTLLRPEEEKKVRQNVKNLRAKYEQEDMELKEIQRSGKASQRKALRDEWEKYNQECLRAYEEEKARILEIRGGSTGDEDDYEMIEETVEEIIEMKEEVDYSKKMLNSEDERD